MIHLKPSSAEQLESAPLASEIARCLCANKRADPLFAVKTQQRGELEGEQRQGNELWAVPDLRASSNHPGPFQGSLDFGLH